MLGADAVVLGRLRKAALDGLPDAKVAAVMQPGPSTTRPDTHPDELQATLEHADLTTALPSDPDGRLLGIVRRADLQRRGA